MPLPNNHQPQMWWDISCIYKGKITWAIAFGDSLEEAAANFKHSLSRPEHATILRVKPIPECTGIEAMSALPPGDSFQFYDELDGRTILPGPETNVDFPALLFFVESLADQLQYPLHNLLDALRAGVDRHGIRRGQ